MTVETKLALSAEEVRSFSQKHAEPATFADFRVSAMEKLLRLTYQNQTERTLASGTSLISLTTQ